MKSKLYQYTINTLIIFLLLPYIYIVVQTFVNENETKVISYLFSSDAKVFELLLNTFYICFFSSFLTLLLAIPIAWFLFRTNVYAKSFLQFLVLVAIAIPTQIQISTWLGLIGESGFITPYLKNIFTDFSIYNLHGAVWITIWSYIPIAIIFCGYIFLAIDNNIETEAKLYLSNTAIFFRLIMPIVKKQIFYLWLFLSFLLFGDVSITDILGIQNTLPQKIYLLFNIYYEPELALYLSLPTLATLLLPLFIVVISQKRKKWRNKFFAINKEVYQLKKHKALASFFVIFFIFIFWLPIPVLAYITQTFQKFIDIFWAIESEILQSFFICFITTTATCFLAIWCAWKIVRKQNNVLLISTLVWLAFVPAPLAGIAVMRIANKLAALPYLSQVFISINNSPFWLIIALLSKFLPLATLILYFVLQQIPKQWEEMAILDGYSPIMSFWRVTVPLMMPNLIIAYVTVFIFCLGEAIISILMIPPGTTTLSVRILTLLHNGARADVAASSLWFIIIVFAICFISVIARQKFVHLKS